MTDNATELPFRPLMYDTFLVQYGNHISLQSIKSIQSFFTRNTQMNGNTQHWKIQCIA